MRHASAMALVLCALSMPALADELEGRYAVRGVNPGGSGGYSGTATVEKTGDTYRVTWVIGSSRYVGTAIGSPSGIAVTYRAGDSTGVAIYTPVQGGFSGFWTYAGGRLIGEERWSR